MSGHFNSVKSLSFSPTLNKDAFYLASGSQDHNIRIWKVQPMANLASDQVENEETKETEDDTWMKQFETKTSFVLKNSADVAYNFSLESVLQHHQEAVSSTCWLSKNIGGRPLELVDLRLLSSSFDFNVSLWEADAETEVWSVETNLGAMVGNKHAFFGAMFLGSLDQILAYTYGGAMHQWKKNKETDQWQPSLTVKGHFSEVTDMTWDEHHLALVSTSLDQTTRIFSEHTVPGHWYEIGRPQIHGYDMNAMCVIKNQTTTDPSKTILSSKILSGGDEKVLRLFEAPYNFIKTMNSLSPHIAKEGQPSLVFDLQHSNNEVENMIQENAKKQPLGLMNKPAVLLANKGMRVDEEQEGGAGAEFDPITVLSNTRKV